jgi:hypothetical protein
MEDREVDISLRDRVQHVRERVLSHQTYNLDGLGFAEASFLRCGDIGVADCAARLYDVNRKTDRRGGFSIGRRTFPRQRRIFRCDLRKIEAEIGMRGKAIVPAIRLGDRNRNALSGPDVQCPGQSAIRPRNPSRAAGLKAMTRDIFGMTSSFL